MKWIILSCLLSAPALWAEVIYKWIDEDGTIQFSNTEPESPVHTEMIVIQQEPATQKTQPSVSSQKLSRSMLSSTPTNNRQSGPEKNPEIQSYCKDLHNNLALLKSQQKVRLLRGDGSYEVLNAKGVQRERQKVQGEIQEYCS